MPFFVAKSREKCNHLKMKKYFLDNKLLVTIYFLSSFWYGFIFGVEGFIDGFIQIGETFIFFAGTSAYSSFSNGFFTAVGAAFAFILLLYLYFLTEKAVLESTLKVIPEMILDFDKMLVESGEAKIDSLWEKIDKIVPSDITQQSFLFEMKENFVKLKKKYKEISLSINDETNFLKAKLENGKEISFLTMIHEFIGKKHFGGTSLSKFQYEVNKRGDVIKETITDTRALLNEMESLISKLTTKNFYE